MCLFFCTDLFSSDQLRSRGNNSLKLGYCLMPAGVLSPKELSADNMVVKMVYYQCGEII